MKMLSVAVVILISTVGRFETPTIINDVRELISAPSFIPEEELYTHIAGGYFSSYDMKNGQFQKSDKVNLPNFEHAEQVNVKGKNSIKIILSNLYYDSRFVYLPEGELILSKGTKDEEIFSLNKLDYVQIAGSDIPAYRLSAENKENNKIYGGAVPGDYSPMQIDMIFTKIKDKINCLVPELVEDYFFHLPSDIKNAAEYDWTTAELGSAYIQLDILQERPFFNCVIKSKGFHHTEIKSVVDAIYDKIPPECK